MAYRKARRPETGALYASLQALVEKLLFARRFKVLNSNGLGGKTKDCDSSENGTTGVGFPTAVHMYVGGALEGPSFLEWILAGRNECVSQLSA
ncbi:hypothetical protein LshimejAT787_1000700 [Lyophyllum shimeji]|uniref:Uncharacterized protein n=1 Tax=Lyophyllum shimeji TaxID=47721 RepID=A0A9P3URL3_LYOSH|nr:hypothetical protein LshimejAT787_1000700 [Lyophyllum shimeji]